MLTNFPVKSLSGKTPKLSLALRVLIIIAGLTTLGSTAPVVVTDSTGADIDQGFTFEIIDQTCGDSRPSEIAIATSEHIAAGGETIYLTKFGKVETGFSGKCSYDPASFLAAYDPAGDFQIADTVSVNSISDVYDDIMATGFNFLKSTGTCWSTVEHYSFPGLFRPSF